MTWPTSDVNTTNADAGTDSPATFRTDVLDLLQKFNLLRTHVSTLGQSLLSRATAALMRSDLGAAASGVNTDITSLNAPALGAATAATQAVNNNTTKVATTAFVIGQASNTVPAAGAGAGAVGVATTFARGDHAHPAADSLGVNQTWQDMTAIRASGVNYTNSTGRTIAVNVASAAGSNTTVMVFATVGASTFSLASDNSAAFPIAAGQFIVPPGSTYSFTVANAAIGSVFELR